jgi:hypothetical protein
MTEISLTAGSAQFHLGNLDPGKDLDFARRLSGEGALQIHFIAHGKRWAGEACYYSDNYPFKGELTFTDGGLARRCA